MDEVKTNTNWRHMGEEVITPPEGAYGFIYAIQDDKGKVYIGKKAFEHNIKKTLSKKARAEAENSRIRIERVKKDSGWRDYWGSCKDMLAYIAERGSTDGFQRYILKYAADKQNLAYWETAILMKEGVLFKDTYNGNIAGKYFKGKIHE